MIAGSSQPAEGYEGRPPLDVSAAIGFIRPIRPLRASRDSGGYRGPAAAPSYRGTNRTRFEKAAWQLRGGPYARLWPKADLAGGGAFGSHAVDFKQAFRFLTLLNGGRQMLGTFVIYDER